ncbi:MAG: helix-turn-helix domain-containing protein [Thermodesulfobacteriota bacterium]
MNKYGAGPGEGPVEFSGGYFQVPDLVFDLKLTANEKLVLIYFMRRADRAGRSFPSVERICRDCGFGSRNTAYKAINNLVNLGLICRSPVPGRSHNYFVSKDLCRIIEEAKARYKNGEPAYNLYLRGSALSRRSLLSSEALAKEDGEAGSDRGNLMQNSDDLVSSNFAVSEEEGRVNKTSPTCSEYEHPCSDNEQPDVQNMNTKEYTVEGNTGKEHTVKTEARKKQKRAHEEARASSSFPAPDDYEDDNKVTMLEASEHFQSLTPRERKEFDKEAQKLGKPGEPDPQDNLWQRRLLRVRYLQQLREGPSD